MCYTVTKKPLMEMPAYIKIPVIVVYVPIVLFGIGYFNVAFNLLTFPRFHEVRNFFLKKCSSKHYGVPPSHVLLGKTLDRSKQT